MFLLKKDMKEHRVMIGILYGVRNNLLMNFMRKDYNHIKKLIILEIGMNYAEKIIL